jgi:hypothetical protein
VKKKKSGLVSSLKEGERERSREREREREKCVGEGEKRANAPSWVLRGGRGEGGGNEG